MTVVRDRHPFQNRVLRVLGRMLRHGSVEFLVVLPDGSKTLIPAVFTDAVAAPTSRAAVTVGAVEDLVQLALVVESLLPPATIGTGAVEDATGVPAKEDSRAPDQSAGFRPRRGISAAGGDGGATGRSARAGQGGGGAEVGVPDRPASRLGRGDR